ncbi:MAG TPA: TetR/AcrR family transcriptional regulator [Xanthobacteraceae bacterium]|nr:TetR/AcrR family transcriptional regulator [Xanthobacteraceae bacterium]
MTTNRTPRGGRVAAAVAGPAESRSGRRARNKRDKLIRIKNAARKLFVSKGFDDATLREIAASAGVGLGTVFLYAADKRDLLFLIANDGLEEAAAAAAATVRPNAPLLDNLLAVFRRHYSFFARQPVLSRLVLREMTFYETGAQARAFQATRDALIALIAKAVTLAMEQGGVAVAETPRLIGWTIFCIYQVELRRWLSDGDLDLRKGMNRLRRTLNVCVTGLGPAAKPKPARSATVRAPALSRPVRQEPRPRAAAHARR